AVQELATQAALAAGRRLSGRKVGLTSLAVQQQLGVDQPDFGMLFADMECHDGQAIDSTRLIQPKAEGEIAFIVDSAIEDWKITLVDTVADNASSGLYVLGKTPVSLHGLDLALEGMLLEKNGAQAAIGVGAACMGNPLDACLWLARTMA
uniref:PTA_PTB domain-containing protein n=1 Tax=Steinernema glaseri TaxID=37863 RepID=A0A1I7Z8E4_9BILA